jgi:hypothetical protein
VVHLHRVRAGAREKLTLTIDRPSRSTQTTFTHSTLGNLSNNGRNARSKAFMSLSFIACIFASSRPVHFHRVRGAYS